MERLERIFIILFIGCAILMNVINQIDFINNYDLIGVIFSLSFIGLCILYINYKNFSFFDIIFILSIFLGIGGLLKVLHWSGSNELLAIGLISYLLIVIALTKSAIKNLEIKKISLLYLSIVIILLIQGVSSFYENYSRISIVADYLNYVLLMILLTLLINKQYFKEMDRKIFIVISLPTILIVIMDTFKLIE